MTLSARAVALCTFSPSVGTFQSANLATQAFTITLTALPANTYYATTTKLNSAVTSFVYQPTTNTTLPMPPNSFSSFANKVTAEYTVEKILANGTLEVFY